MPSGQPAKNALYKGGQVRTGLRVGASAAQFDPYQSFICTSSQTPQAWIGLDIAAIPPLCFMGTIGHDQVMITSGLQVVASEARHASGCDNAQSFASLALSGKL